MTAEVLLIAGAILAAAVILAILVIFTRRSPSAISPILEQRLLGIEGAIGRSDSAIREEFGRGRDENREGSRSLREEVTSLFERLAGSLRASLSDLSTAQQAQLETFATRLNETRTEATTNARNLREEIRLTLNQLGDGVSAKIGELITAQGEKLDTVTGQITALTEGNERRQETLRANVEARLGELKTDAGVNARALREEVTGNLQNLANGLRQTIEQISQSQIERLDRVSGSVAELTQKSGEQQEALRRTVEERLDVIRTENSEKLEQMRQTVDENLHNTLEQRLGASFRMVSDWLEQVYRSMGEMQQLASGVGDLTRLLANVRSRGAWGEVALGNILEQVMAPDQYDRNVEIVPGSNERVEYAIRLPGDGEKPVWLPLDAKFPIEDYDRLTDASQRGDSDGVETAARAIETRIRSSARDISEKYIHSPYSTEFAVLFLPVEGLYAEVLRRPGLTDALQREHHIMVAGPSNLAALLVSFRMGFRCLAIQRRSSEVWRLLSAVKTEFGRFGGVIDKVSRKLQETQNVIDVEVGRRRRAMDRKLQGVEALPEPEAVAVLGLEAEEDPLAEEAERDAAE
jgi:DNA recombination protein RmuC